MYKFILLESHMLSNPKFMEFSDFYKEVILNKGSHLHPHIKKPIDKNPIGNKVGIFESFHSCLLNPLYSHIVNDCYKDIYVKNIKSHLKRNRYLSNKKYPEYFNYRMIYRAKLLDGDFDNIFDRMVASAKNTELCIESYGAGDSVNQIYNRLNFLNRIKNRNFTILVGYVDKNIMGDFRQSKNGGYYGVHKLEHEYLEDEDCIDGLYCFNIIETKSLKDTATYCENYIFCKSNYHIYVFDRKCDNELICILYNNRGTYKLTDRNDDLLIECNPESDFNLVDQEIHRLVTSYKNTKVNIT